jgi:hypothetical protein
LGARPGFVPERPDSETEKTCRIYAKVKNPGFPIVGNFDQQGIAFAVLFSVFDGLVKAVAAACHARLVAGESQPTIGFGLAQDTDSFLVGHHNSLVIIPKFVITARALLSMN